MVELDSTEESSSVEASISIRQKAHTVVSAAGQASGSAACTSMTWQISHSMTSS